MPKNLRFWSNVGLIAVAHVVALVGLIRWSRAEKNSSSQSIVWMSGGAGDGVLSTNKNPTPRKESRVDSLKDRDPDDDRPFLASAPSEIQLPTPTATPIRTPSPRSTSTPTPAPSPKIKGTPKAKPKPTAKPTPKPTPKPSPKKIVLAKASPKPSAKPTPEKEEDKPAEGPSEVVKAIPVKEQPKPTETQTGTGKGTLSGSGGGRAGGSANEGRFSWYGGMLHDRFYSEWVQPTKSLEAGGKNSVLVKLRIEKDGRVSSFEVVRPSGNAELDDSVKALANRVSQVDPLPDGLGKGEHYDVKINFELNSE